jgi:hypothetical protein
MISKLKNKKKQNKKSKVKLIEDMGNSEFKMLRDST